MSGWFEYKYHGPGDEELRIGDGSRETFSLDNIPLITLPNANDVNLSNYDVVFPDFEKGYAHRRTDYTSYSSATNETARSYQCISAVTALPQVWQQVDTIATIPAGCDMLLIKAKGSRTVSPQQTWMGDPILARAQNKSLTFTSGMIVEEARGMARTLAFFIDGTALKLRRKQSVSVPPGGGEEITGWSPNNALFARTLYSFGPEKGLPIFQIPEGAGGAKSTSYVSTGGVHTNPHRIDGPDPCTISYATNHASTWRFNFNIKLGRRS